MIGKAEIALIKNIEKMFCEEKMAESRSSLVFAKKALWEVLQEVELDCIRLIIPPVGKYDDLCEVKIPDNVGNFLRDIAGNSLDIAIWILQYLLPQYDRLYEAEQFTHVVGVTHLLCALKIYINNAKSRPDKHSEQLEPFSNHESWGNIYEFYKSQQKFSRIHWDINGEYRHRFMPDLKGKRLKKSMTFNRCLLCHNWQTQKTLFCEIHESQSKTNNEQHKVVKWVRDAYQYLCNGKFTMELKEVSLFTKSYELHTWAKWHPVQKAFKKSVYDEILQILVDNESLTHHSSSSAPGVSYRLEKVYRRHPFIEDFSYNVGIGSDNILDTYHSLALESEHTLIKVAASKRLRKKYDFDPAAQMEGRISISQV